MPEATVKNYSDEAVARLHEVYDGTADEAERDAQVQELSVELAKCTRSIRAKLTREGIYVPKAKAPAGKAVVRKAELVTAIAKAMGADEDVIGSLEKATKVALTKVLNALTS